MIENNFGSNNELVSGCEFVADYGIEALTSNLLLSEFTNVTCIDFDADECAAPDIMTPAPIVPGSPTSSPVAAQPTRAPRRTSAPTMTPEDEGSPVESPVDPGSSAFSLGYSLLAGVLSLVVGAALV